MKKILCLLLFLVTFVFSQTPDGSRKVWNDTLLIDRGGTFIDIMTIISDSSGGPPLGIDSSSVNGLISDSLDAVYLPIMLWTASDVADTSLNDSIEAGNYSRPPDDRYPGFYTDHTSYIKVLRISYYNSSEIDSIAFINQSIIGIGGEDGYIRMNVVGFDSVEVNDIFPFDATPRLSMSGASIGKTTIEIEIYTSNSGVPFVCYPICIIGYYKLR